MMIVDNVHEIGDIVYLKVDSEQAERMVTGFVLRQTETQYLLFNTINGETTHSGFEISVEKTIRVV